MNHPVRLWVVAAAACVALACARPLPEQSPLSVSPLQFERDEWRIVEQVVVVTDGSGTMYVNETFPEAKALTRSFVAAMPDPGARSRSESGYAAGLIGFGGDERIAAPLTRFDRTRLQATAQELRILGSVDGLGGETPLHDVLSETRQALDGQRGRVAVVVFSDGLPDSSRQALFQARSLAAEYADGVCFHTVQTGDDPAGASFLTELANVTQCGSTRSAEQIRTQPMFMAFTRQVFAGGAPLPRVAAPADPCAERVSLDDVNFAFDRAEISATGASRLNMAASRLKQCPDVRIAIEGHTDAIGSEGYNQDLSRRRAEAARRYLERQGVPVERLSTRALGESQPVASNETESGRAQNRRVELVPR